MSLLGRLGLTAEPRDLPKPAAGSDWKFSVLLGLIALLPRLYVAIAWAREPVWDGHYYHYGALRIAQGLGYSEDVLIGGELVWKPWCHYPVGYSGILGALYFVFGASLLVAPLFGAVVGTTTAVASHRLARYFLGQNRARVAGLLVALHPGLIAYAAVVMTEPVAALSLILAGLVVFAFRTSLIGLVLAGILVGLGALVRPPSLAAAPLLFFAFKQPWRAAFAKSGLVLTVAVLTVVPWTIRNCNVMDGCAFISTNGGWNMAIGALTPTGRFHGLHAEDGCRVVTGQVQQDRCWMSVGLKHIASHPGPWLKKVPKKLEHTYNHESFPVAYLAEANPLSWDNERRSQTQSVLTVYHHLLMFGACLSLIAFPLRRRETPEGEPRAPFWRVELPKTGAARTQAVLLLGFLTLTAWVLSFEPPPLYALISAVPLLALLPIPGAPRLGPAGRYLVGAVLATTLTHAVFFGDDRYHMVVSPVLCVLAAAALRPLGAGART